MVILVTDRGRFLEANVDDRVASVVKVRTPV